MRRRDFIALVGRAAATWPLAARAQQGERMRRIGWLWPFDEDDPAGRLWMAAFTKGLADLGWVAGRNLRIDVRWNPKTSERVQTAIQELIAQQPDVLLTVTARLTLALQQQTKTVPIVIVGAGDVLASGIVPSLSHPGGNTTGVTDIFPSLAGKWIEILKQCLPSLAQVALVRDANLNPASFRPGSTGANAVTAAQQSGLTTTEILVRNADDIARAIPAFATAPNGAVVMLPPPLPGPQRRLINDLTIQYRLPVIYQDRSMAIEGGLLSYGTDITYQFEHDAPPYVDRILRGAKPGDLPVQQPSKFVLAVNLTTAKAMGFMIPETLLARADEVIE
jgi:putative ABC transport system substrate-binding protein